MTLGKIIKIASKHLTLLKVLTLVWAFLITLLCIIPQEDLPKAGGIPHFDKFVHFVLYFVLTFLSLFIFWGSKQSRRVISVLIPGIFVFSLLIEIMQGILPFGRTFSFVDLLANLSGIVAGLLLFHRIKYLLILSQQ